MAEPTTPEDILSYHSSARRDIRPWAMFVVGTVFAYGGWSIDPLTNCSEDGECAPWLVPIAFVMGSGLGIIGLAMLIANPKRGSHIDEATGELVWWQDRFSGSKSAKEGRINPAEISRIRIVKQSDSADEVHLYNMAGERLHYFDEEVIGWDKEGWAKAMADRCPHIAIEVAE